MKFNKNTITLNLDDINRIAGYAVESHYYNESKGYEVGAKEALEFFESLYNYLESRGYYDDVKNN